MKRLLPKFVLSVIVFLFLLNSFVFAQDLHIGYTAFLDKIIDWPYEFILKENQGLIYIQSDSPVDENELKFKILEIASTILWVDAQASVKEVAVYWTHDNIRQEARLNISDLISRFNREISLAELFKRIKMRSFPLNKEAAADIKTESSDPAYLQLPVDYENIKKIQERQQTQQRALDCLEEAKQANLSGDYEKTLEYSQEALNINNHLVEAYFQMGLAYKSLGNYTRALENLKKYIDFEPGGKKAYLAMAEIYARLEQWNKSLTHYKYAASLDDRLVNFLTDLPVSVTASELNNLEDYVKSHPEDLRAALKLALMYEAKGYFQKGVSIYQQIFNRG